MFTAKFSVKTFLSSIFVTEKMSSKAQKPSRLLKSKKASETDHCYTKSIRQSQRGQKYKPSFENENDCSSDEGVSLIEESAPCHGCKKQIAMKRKTISNAY